MKTSSLIAAAATTFIAVAAWGGGDLVRAFPGDAAPAMAKADQPAARNVAYQWRDYWDRGGADAATRACPARKSISLSWEGPRLSWQRSCARPG